MKQEKYKAVFIDIDDTILDFNKCSQQALEESCKHIGIPYSYDLYAYFYKVDKALWDRQKLGEISVEEVLQIRFETLCDSLPQTIEPLLFNKTFQANLAKTTVLIAGAKETLQYLSSKYTLYAASNGILEMQTSRLKRAGLYDYFKDLYVSDAIGFEKPDSRFYKSCLSQSKCTPEEVLFVGDSWEADIEGAMQLNIDSCWFTQEPRDNRVKYQVKTLEELKGYV